MANPYTKQSATNYNASPPPDDGSQTSSNLITWAGIKSKLADPIKALADAINTAVFNAFAVVARTDQSNTFSATNTFSAAATFTANPTIQSSDSGAAVNPILTLDRASASPAASDVLGEIVWSGMDSGANSTTYGAIAGQINDPTNGSEDAELQLYTIVAGTLAIRLKVGQGLVIGSATGGDKGASSVNCSKYYQNGALGAVIRVAGAVSSNALESGSLGVTSVTHSATGTYNVVFSTAFSGTGFIPIATGAGGAVAVKWSNRSTTGITFTVFDTTTSSAVDGTFSFMIIGDF